PPARSTSASTLRRTGRPLTSAPLDRSPSLAILLRHSESRCHPQAGGARSQDLLKLRGSRDAPTPVNRSGLAPRAVHTLNAVVEHRPARVVQLVDDIAEALGVVALPRDLDQPVQQLGSVRRPI